MTNGKNKALKLGEYVCYSPRKLGGETARKITGHENGRENWPNKREIMCHRPPTIGRENLKTTSW